jgi:hypothetical protein
VLRPLDHLGVENGRKVELNVIASSALLRRVDHGFCLGSNESGEHAAAHPTCSRRCTAIAPISQAHTNLAVPVVGAGGSVRFIPYGRGGGGGGGGMHPDNKKVMANRDIKYFINAPLTLNGRAAGQVSDDVTLVFFNVLRRNVLRCDGQINGEQHEQREECAYRQAV